MDKNLFLLIVGRSLRLSETVFNAILVIACWYAVFWLYCSGRAALLMAGVPPTHLRAILAAVEAPGILARLLDWGWGAVAVAVAAALALSAMEGTWWLARRAASEIAAWTA